MSLATQPAGISALTPFSEDRLRDALDGVRAGGDFAGDCDIKDVRDPRIVVDGLGEIDLPLSEEQARRIISKAHRAPSSKDRQPVVGAPIPGTWELDPQDFEVTAGPQWHGLLGNVVALASRRLGISGPIRAILSNMLISEKGAVCNARAKRENSQTLGTVMISLPSPHEGGDIIVKRFGERKTLSTSKYVMACAFWCSDSSHEMLPIESGYRWALTYNLMTVPSPKEPTRSMPWAGNKLLRDVIESWAEEKRAEYIVPFYYALDHKYTQEGISLTELKSRDRARIEHLIDSCHNLEFDIFLVTLEREDVDTTTRNGDHDDYDDGSNYCDRWLYEEEEDEDEDSYHKTAVQVESTLRAKTIYDLNGNQVLSSVAIDKKSLLQDNPFGEHPDQEDRERRESRVTRWYTSSALAIVPSKAIIPFFTSPDSPLSKYRFDPGSCEPFNYLIDRYKFAESEWALETLLYLLPKMSEVNKLDWATSTVVVEKLYQVAITCNGSKLLNCIIRCGFSLPFTVLGWLRRQFEMSIISFERLSRGLSHVVQIQKSLNSRYRAILAFHGDIDLNDKLLGLLRVTAIDAVDNWGVDHSYKDGQALFDLGLYSCDNLEYMKSFIIPKLMATYSRSTSFMLGFIQRWEQCMRREQISIDEAKPIYENLVRATMSSSSIPSLTVEEVHVDKRARADPEYDELKAQVVSYEILHRFIVSLFRPEFEAQRDSFVRALTVQSKSLKPINYKNLWIPLLQDLLSACEKLKISLYDRSWQQLYQTVLKNFILKYVGEPLPQSNLVRKRVSCVCGYCRDMNKFLVDPAQRTIRIRADSSRLGYKLSCFHIDCRAIPERQDNSFVLLTKTDKGFDEEERLREGRKIDAAKHLWGFHQQKLSTILADKYETIMMMYMVESTTISMSSANTTTTNATPTSPWASSSTPGPAPLSLMDADLTEEIRRLEDEMDRLVNGTASSAATPIKNNVTVREPAVASATPAQIISSVVVVPPSRSQSPQTTMPRARRTGLSTMGSAAALPETPRNRFSSSPLQPTWRGPSRSRTSGSFFTQSSGTTATRSVSNPSQPPSSSFSPHPVAGVKRKMIEVIDLTLDDD